MECAQCSPRGSYLRGINAGNHGTATTSDRRLQRALGRQQLQSCPLMDRRPGSHRPRLCGVCGGWVSCRGTKESTVSSPYRCAGLTSRDVRAVPARRAGRGFRRSAIACGRWKQH